MFNVNRVVPDKGHIIEQGFSIRINKTHGKIVKKGCVTYESFFNCGDG